METDDINLAAKRSIKWVEEVIQNNLNKNTTIHIVNTIMNR